MGKSRDGLPGITASRCLGLDLNPDGFLVCALSCQANLPLRDETGCPPSCIGHTAVLGREPLAFLAAEGDGHRGSGVPGCPRALLDQGLCHACLASAITRSP